MDSPEVGKVKDEEGEGKDDGEDALDEDEDVPDVLEGFLDFVAEGEVPDAHPAGEAHPKQEDDFDGKVDDPFGDVAALDMGDAHDKIGNLAVDIDLVEVAMGPAEAGKSPADKGIKTIENAEDEAEDRLDGIEEEAEDADPDLGQKASEAPPGADNPGLAYEFAFKIGSRA